MPFTFSHPAIVLPLNCLSKKWFSLTGLVIGSMIPDFEYFLRMRIQSNYSHTMVGLFWFDLPLGILVAFIFHNIVRNSLIDNLPHFLNARFGVFKEVNWNKYVVRNWFILILSILIGAGSHLLWDSFTHDNGYFVQTLPALTKAIEISGMQILVLKMLQHGSTLIGGLVIIYTIYRMPVEENVKVRINAMYWVVFIAIILIVLLIRLLGGLDFRQYGNLIVSGISAGLLSFILTPCLVRKK